MRCDSQNWINILYWTFFILKCNIIFPDPKQNDPCIPSPCGPNAICQKRGNTVVCTCPPDLLGDPTSVSGCRPECVLSSDCPGDKACINTKCVNPCSRSVCGFGADCTVINHSPLCSCPHPKAGNPFIECHDVEGELKEEMFNTLINPYEDLIIINPTYRFILFFLSNTLCIIKYWFALNEIMGT